MVTKHVLKLSAGEREQLSEVAKGTRGSRVVAQWKVVRAKALLGCDEGEHGPSRSDAEAAVAARTTPWARDRNRRQTGVDWQFTTDDARTRLRRLYPKVKT